MLMFLLESALRSLVLGVTVWIGLRALRVANPHLEMTIWKVVLIAALAMPLLAQWATVTLPAAPSPLTGMFAPSIDALSRQIHSSSPTAALEPSDPAPDFSDPSAGVSAPTPSGGGPASTPLVAAIDWYGVATGLYLLVAGTLLLHLLTGVALIFRLARSARPLGPDWAAGANVRASESIATPVTFGSTILLPVDCESWSTTKRRAVLSHEISHIVRRDFYLLLLAALHRVVFWFNPFAWWLPHRLVELMEIISDDAAIEALGDAPAYAEVLLDVAMGPRPEPMPAGIAMARPPTVGWRVDRILAGATRLGRPGRCQRLLVATAVIPVVALCAVTIAHGTSPIMAQSVGSESGSSGGTDQAEDKVKRTDAMFDRLFGDQTGPRTAATTDPDLRPQPDAADVSSPDRYAGFYEAGPRDIFTITRDGDQLFAQLTGQQKLPIFAESDREYAYRAVAAAITFATDHRGLATALVLHLKGRDLRAPRIDDLPSPGRRQPDVDAGLLNGYIGSYQIDPRTVLVIARGGHGLVVTEPGQPRVEVVSHGPEDFCSDDERTCVMFKRGREGWPSDLILYDKARGAVHATKLVLNDGRMRQAPRPMRPQQPR